MIFVTLKEMKISNNIIEAGTWLTQNNVIAIPTETVYGLAASIYNEKASTFALDIGSILDVRFYGLKL